MATRKVLRLRSWIAPTILLFSHMLRSAEVTSLRSELAS